MTDMTDGFDRPGNIEKRLVSRVCVAYGPEIKPAQRGLKRPLDLFPSTGEYRPLTLAEHQECVVSDIAELGPVTAERIREVAGAAYEP